MTNGEWAIANYTLTIIHHPLKNIGGYSKGDHLFPFRTEKLSPLAPMVLPLVGE